MRYREVMGDLVGSVVVIVAGLEIVVTGWMQVDTIASAVGLLILPRS